MTGALAGTDATSPAQPGCAYPHHPLTSPCIQVLCLYAKPRYAACGLVHALLCSFAASRVTRLYCLPCLFAKPRYAAYCVVLLCPKSRYTVVVLLTARACAWVGACARACAAGRVARLLS